MSCKPDPNLSKADAAAAIATTLAELRCVLDLDFDPAAYVNGLAMVNILAWAIDGARNMLPTSPAVSTVLGLHDVDQYGEPPQHVVALTALEIEQLHGNYVYAASKMKKPRRGDWAPDFKASHEYYTARAALFERLLPPPDVDQDEVDQAANEVRDPADIRSGGGMTECGHVVMEEPGGYLPVRRAAGPPKAEAEQPIATDEASLRDLVENCTSTVTGLLTPEIAGWLLRGGSRSGNSIDPSEDAAVAQLADILQRRQWVTCTAILLASSGLIVDGRRRLMAIQRSGVPAFATVAFGYDGPPDVVDRPKGYGPAGQPASRPAGEPEPQP